MLQERKSDKSHNPTAILMLATADWSRPLWTNKQHLARGLSKRFPVTYVNSMSLRQPTLTIKDVRRGLTKLWRTYRAVPNRADSGNPGLAIIEPCVVPVFLETTFREVARQWNTRRLRSIAQRAWPGGARRVLWTFHPFTYGVEEQADLVVYHSVDLLHVFPGVPTLPFLEEERKLARLRNLHSIASSDPVAEHLVKQSFQSVSIWPNVADVELFGRYAEPWRMRPRSIAFGGNLSAHKVDFELLFALVQGLPDVHLHLAGPIDEGGKSRATIEPSRLFQRDNVTYHGILTPDQLARLFGSVRCGIIPYVLNEYTRGVFPMKVYEYIAADCNVVSTALPSLQGVSGVRLTGGIDDFISEVRAALQTPSTAHPNLADHGWDSRIDEAIRLISVGQ